MIGATGPARGTPRNQAEILIATQIGAPSFTRSNRLQRLLWRVTWFVLASWTPDRLRPWRRFLLVLFGASIGREADVRGSARVWYPPNLTLSDRALVGPGVNCYNMAPISIGREALISQNAFLCAGSHDVNAPTFQLVARPITIGAKAWIAAEAFVAPGVTVGEGAVLSARGAAFADLDPWTVYRGNPAAPLRPRRRAGHAPEPL